MTTSCLGRVLLVLALLAPPGALLAEEAEEGHGGVAFLDGHPPFTDVLAQAREQAKPVFIDFTTDWCGWCRRLEKDTFSQPEVAAAMEAFVNVVYDAEKGEGVDLAKRYNARGFPTLVIVDAEGAEIDRLVGYRKPEPFQEEIARILRDEGTLRALRRVHEAAPDDAEAALSYARKLMRASPEAADRFVADLAVRLADATPGTPGASAPVALKAEVALLQADSARDRRDVDAAVAGYEAVVRHYADTPAAAKAAVGAAGLLGRTDPLRALALLGAVQAHVAGSAEEAQVRARTVELHLAAAGRALAAGAAAAGDDAEGLNEAAWQAYLHKLEVRQAVAWAERAVEASQRAPHVLDTLAHLYFEVGRVEDAVTIEQEALEAVTDARMARDFREALLRFTVTAHLRAAAGSQAPRTVPATPLVPMPPKEKPPRPAVVPAPSK